MRYQAHGKQGKLDVEFDKRHGRGEQQWRGFQFSQLNRLQFIHQPGSD